MGRLAEVIKFEYGFDFQAEFTPKPITLVAATITEILKENPDRVRWTVVNLGTEVVYLSHDPAPSATNGYYLDSNGGTISMSWDEDGELTGYAIHALSSGTPTLFISAIRAI